MRYLSLTADLASPRVLRIEGLQLQPISAKFSSKKSAFWPKRKMMRYFTFVIFREWGQTYICIVVSLWLGGGWCSNSHGCTAGWIRRVYRRKDEEKQILDQAFIVRPWVQVMDAKEIGPRRTDPSLGQDFEDPCYTVIGLSTLNTQWNICQSELYIELVNDMNDDEPDWLSMLWPYLNVPAFFNLWLAWLTSSQPITFIITTLALSQQIAFIFVPHVMIECWKMTDLKSLQNLLNSS